MLLKMVLVVCVAVVALDASAAFAQERMTRDFTVSKAGLDLNRPADAQTMYRRIEHAATDVCRNGFGRRPLNERREEERCIRNAVRDAINELDAPHVTTVHQARGNDPVQMTAAR